MPATHGDRAKLGALLAVAVLFICGCMKTEVFPPEPAIKFKSFSQFSDSASLTISFVDGDGDIGLNDGDTLAPFNVDPYKYNLYLDYDTMANNVWHRVTFATALQYRIPRITPTGQNKTLDGEVAVALPWPFFLDGLRDTARFTVRLYDRALHVSNSVVSETIYIDP
ncbi:MAG TPA: hypothetical protein PK760_08340 [Flavobacteriales bacterium]|nr:hypothetical protein [Flavobacteriales bacterium]